MPHTNMPVCPTDDVLSQYLDGGLPPRRRPDLEIHLAACPACLDVLSVLRGDPAVPRPAVSAPARRTGFRVAAAALALAAGAAAWLWGKGTGAPAPTASPSYVSVPMWPSIPSPLPAPAWAAAGVDLVAEAGTDASLHRDGTGRPQITLRRGSLWITASRETALETPAGPLILRDAEVWTSRTGGSAPLASLLFREAAASSQVLEDDMTVVLLQGLAVWKGHPLIPGQELAIRRDSTTLTAADTGRVNTLRAGRSRRLHTLGDWRDLLDPGERLDKARREAAFALGALGPSYRMLIRLGDREAATEVAVALPTPEGLRQWTARLPSRTRGPDCLLELTSDGEIFTARVDGIPVLSAPLTRLASVLETASGNPGIRSWGGGLRVDRASLSELPAR